MPASLPHLDVAVAALEPARSNGSSNGDATDEPMILFIHFNRRSKRNALSVEAFNDVTRLIRWADGETTVRAIILTGRERKTPTSSSSSSSSPSSSSLPEFYSSGMDLTMFLGVDASDEKAVATMRSDCAKLIRDFIYAFIDSKKPIIAECNGPAVGVAATTLALCDFVFANEEFTMTTPFIDVAQCPEAVSSVLFPEILGPRLANEVLLLGRQLSAQECERYGFVNAIVPKAHLTEKARLVAAQLALSPPETLDRSRRLIRTDAKRSHWREVCDLEVKGLLECWQSDELYPAIMGFFQKQQEKQARAKL